MHGSSRNREESSRNREESSRTPPKNYVFMHIYLMKTPSPFPQPLASPEVRTRDPTSWRQAVGAAAPVDHTAGWPPASVGLLLGVAVAACTTMRGLPRLLRGPCTKHIAPSLLGTRLAVWTGSQKAAEGKKIMGTFELGRLFPGW